MSDSSGILPSTSSDVKMDQQDREDAPVMRQPLRPLPPMPLNKRPHQITTNSSPLDSMSTLKSVEPITPPSTPIQPQYQASPVTAGSVTAGTVSKQDEDVHCHDLAETKENAVRQAPTWEETKPRPYTGMYKLQGSKLRDREFGRGVWSVVYRAEAVLAPLPDLPTPPTSPSNSPPRPASAVFAVKSPSRRDADSILYHEARMLTYLHSFPGSTKHLVPFHGFEISTHSILLGPLPVNLDSRIKVAATSARINLSTRIIFDPVVGLPEWSTLASHLVSGLCFLHAQSCVHGDIKPANILLQLKSPGAFEPLYCDFSSSLHLKDPTPTEITALTPDYTAPELLSLLTAPDKRTLPTFAADVYALGVTLLFAAIGESPYASAKLELMKLGMAKEGRPLDFARGSDQASRVRKGSRVERCLLGAFKKEKGRWTVNEWAEELRELFKEKDITQFP